MSKNNINTLPKWAQKLIEGERRRNEDLVVKISTLKKVASYLDINGVGEWSTLMHPSLCHREGWVKLYLLQENNAQAVCDLGPSDFVMVCRNVGTLKQ